MERDETAAPPVRAAMRTDIPPAQLDDSVIAVARALLAAGASSAPVLDPDGMLVGIVSEYDVLAKQGLTAGAVMSRGVITIGPDASAADAARLMGLHGIHVLPVVAADARIMGMVTRTDLLRLFTETRWRCATCGAESFGLAVPDPCAACGGSQIGRDDAV